MDAAGPKWSPAELEGHASDCSSTDNTSLNQRRSTAIKWPEISPGGKSALALTVPPPHTQGDGDLRQLTLSSRPQFPHTRARKPMLTHFLERKDIQCRASNDPNQGEGLSQVNLYWEAAYSTMALGLRPDLKEILWIWIELLLCATFPLWRTELCFRCNFLWCGVLVPTTRG